MLIRGARLQTGCRGIRVQKTTRMTRSMDGGTLPVTPANSAALALPATAKRPREPSPDDSGDATKARMSNQQLTEEATSDYHATNTVQHYPATPNDPDATSYTVDTRDGLRRIRPYFFEFAVWAKRRWIGLGVVDMFVREFQLGSREYYARAVADGRITVNGERVCASRAIADGDRVTHRVHRHEPPVTAQPVRIVGRTDRWIAVEKPSSVPMHPSGAYRYNTIVAIVERELGYGKVYPVHRLDRLTSGIVILALDPVYSNVLAEKFKDRVVSKTYVARVKGVFPAGETLVDQPILTVHHKLGLNMVSPNGKPCQTMFERIDTDGETSVVRCRPITGRTHQIRVHLQWLGHPIANDPLYADERFRLRKELAVAEARAELQRQAECVSAEMLAEEEAAVRAAAAASNAVLAASCQNITDVPATQTHAAAFDTIMDDCAFCQVPPRNPTPSQLEMWLHALSYTCDDFHYETELPAWAQFERVNATRQDDLCTR